MVAYQVFVETGKKKAFAGAVDWPGWCHWADKEPTALQVLVDYGPRYARVLAGSGVDFQVPASAADLTVIERHDGGLMTDFGVPGVVLDVDRQPASADEIRRFEAILQACWRAFDRAARRAEGHELRKGPRGGGRDLEAMVEHVLGGEGAYLGALAWKHTLEKGLAPGEALARVHQEVIDALEAAIQDELPKQKPRGGAPWPVRYFVRRTAWHVLDHAWEIEDRIIG
ncbi:MAG TPA: hypothetical protein VMC62_00515 [Longilinea sp.]|nr:hypothetical protein [Longilinea sp.]